MATELIFALLHCSIVSTQLIFTFIYGSIVAAKLVFSLHCFERPLSAGTLREYRRRANNVTFTADTSPVLMD